MEEAEKSMCTRMTGKNARIILSCEIGRQRSCRPNKMWNRSPTRIQ